VSERKTLVFVRTLFRHRFSEKDFEMIGHKKEYLKIERRNKIAKEAEDKTHKNLAPYAPCPLNRVP
jgi:hypothetical protein